MNKNICLFICLLLFISEMCFANEQSQPKVEQESRVALVIGNGAYHDAPLINPPNDARTVAQALTELGFSVISLENATYSQMQDALRKFGDQLKVKGGVGLFYYAGHGIQYKNNNYLLPVDADILREDEVPFVTFDVARVLQKIESANNRLNILILDACRNNPYARGMRSASKGLAQMDAPSGTIIAFSTAPGAVASDGNGNNGLYTQHLLANISAPNLKIEEVFKRVRVAVKQSSQGQQVPWENTSLEGDFYFNPTTEEIKSNSESKQLINLAYKQDSSKDSHSKLVQNSDKWVYEFTSKNSRKKGKISFEVSAYKSDQIYEVVKLDISNESPYELAREIKSDSGLIGLLTSHGRKFHEFSPYLPVFQNLEEPKDLNKLRRVVPLGSYLSGLDWTISINEVGKESLTLQAGKFDAIKYRVSGSRPTGPGHCEYLNVGSFDQYIWYSPKVRRFIKQQMLTYGCQLVGRGAFFDEETLELSEFLQSGLPK